jgi:hypothetical protein
MQGLARFHATEASSWAVCRAAGRSRLFQILVGQRARSAAFAATRARRVEPRTGPLAVSSKIFSQPASRKASSSRCAFWSQVETRFSALRLAIRLLRKPVAAALRRWMPNPPGSVLCEVPLKINRAICLMCRCLPHRLMTPHWLYCARVLPHVRPASLHRLCWKVARRCPRP